MRGAHEEPELESLRRTGSARLWFATGAPAVAWFAALNAGYFFVSWACARRNGEAILHLITGGALLVCIAAGLAAWSILARIGARGGDEHDDRVERTRFIARLALAFTLVFSLALVTQWIAILIQHPCMPWPRNPFTPDA
ncbi:MAG TPA: hypothetical protein VF039_09040 [Longimicrobiales bacterium]